MQDERASRVRRRPELLKGLLLSLDKATFEKLTLPGALVLCCITAISIYFGGSSSKDTLTPALAALTETMKEGVSALKAQADVKTSIQELKRSVDSGFAKLSDKIQDVQGRTARLEYRADAMQSGLTALSNLAEWLRACVSALNARANIVPPIKEP